MRFSPTLLIAAAAVSAACSSDLPNPGIPGAGVSTEIVSVKQDGGDFNYVVTYKVTNHDTGTVAFGACAGVAEQLSDSGWTQVTEPGQCILIEYGLPPTTSYVGTISQQPLRPGGQVRVAFGWNWRYDGIRQGHLSRTDPANVPYVHPTYGP